MCGVPAAADVPGGEAPAGGRSRMSEEISTLRRGPSPRLGERRSTLRRGPSPRLGERLGAVFLGHRISRTAWVAAGVAMLGLWLLSGAGGEFDLRGDGLVLLCAFSLAAPEGATVWSALLVTSLVASALGFFVQSFAQKHAPPARTALILASEPAFAGLFGWLLNDERLTATGWLGAALIMAAIVAGEGAPRVRPPRPLPGG